MNIFLPSKSKTGQKILNLFFSQQEKDFYLREMEKRLSISAGNIRRELLSLLKLGLFQTYRKGKLLYYRLDTASAYYRAMKILMDKTISHDKDVEQDGYSWVSQAQPGKIAPEVYCPTRDIFSVRLESYGRHLEKGLGISAYLVTAAAGEIGNNSFDHNLGSWQDDPGVYFAYDGEKKTVVLADRGQGIYKTISRVVPLVKDDRAALQTAFTKYISGRSPEKRGNGLKFVTQIVKDKGWRLKFDSGNASLTIDSHKGLVTQTTKRIIRGCFTVLKY